MPRWSRRKRTVRFVFCLTSINSSSLSTRGSSIRGITFRVSRCSPSGSRRAALQAPSNASDSRMEKRYKDFLKGSASEVHKNIRIVLPPTGPMELVMNNQRITNLYELTNNQRITNLYELTNNQRIMNLYELTNDELRFHSSRLIGIVFPIRYSLVSSVLLQFLFQKANNVRFLWWMKPGDLRVPPEPG